MKRITSIDVNIKALEPKLAINANDWTKEEKVHIETAYFEITKVSVGRGRIVDLGCRECVQSAVNIINNYIALQDRAKATEDTKEDWTETLKSVHHKAEELGIEFPVKVKKKEAKIQFIIDAMELIGEQETQSVEETEYTREQLVAIIKAKTGEDVDVDTSVEDMIAYIKELEDESEG
jgi:hypothetical protein